MSLLLAVPEVAEALFGARAKRDTDRVYRLIAEGALRAKSIGRRKFVPRSEMERYAREIDGHQEEAPDHAEASSPRKAPARRARRHPAPRPPKTKRAKG